MTDPKDDQIRDDTTPPGQWTSIADALPPQGELVLFAAVIDDQWADEAAVGKWGGKWMQGAALAMDYGEDDDWLPCTHWRAVPPLPEPAELTMADIGPQRAAPKSVRQVEAECKQVRREAAEVGLEEFPLRSAIETGSALARDNRALRDLCGRLLFHLRSTSRAVPLQIEQDCRRLGVPQLGQQSRDSRRVDELIGLAGG